MSTYDGEEEPALKARLEHMSKASRAFLAKAAADGLVAKNSDYGNDAMSSVVFEKDGKRAKVWYATSSRPGDDPERDEIFNVYPADEDHEPDYNSKLVENTDDPDAAIAAVKAILGITRSNPVRENGIMHQTILDASARAAFVSAYADACDNLGSAKCRAAGYATAGGGEDWMDVAPDTPPESFAWAAELWNRVIATNPVLKLADMRTAIVTTWEIAARADGLDEDDADMAKDFGHYVAMQAMGHGVAWEDDHAEKGFEVPHMEAPMVFLEGGEGEEARTNPEDEGEPGEDDVTTQDHRKFYQSGKLWLTLDRDLSTEEMWIALNAQMVKDHYFPNVWFISDHGNAHLMAPSPSQSFAGAKTRTNPSGIGKEITVEQVMYQFNCTKDRAKDVVAVIRAPDFETLAPLAEKRGASTRYGFRTAKLQVCSAILGTDRVEHVKKGDFELEYLVVDELYDGTILWASKAFGAEAGWHIAAAGDYLDVMDGKAPAGVRTVPEKHQRRIAKADAKMPRAMRDVMSPRKNPDGSAHPMDGLHERIATALGWSMANVRSTSLQALRDLVRPVDAKLADEISNVVQGGTHIKGKRGPFRKNPKAKKPAKKSK